MLALISTLVSAVLSRLAPLPTHGLKEKCTAWGGEPERYRITQPGDPRRHRLQHKTVQRWKKVA